MYGSWDIERDRYNFFVILDHFLPFYSLWTQKIEILKSWKNTWRYYHFTNVYHRWQSYDVWFLRYGVQRREVFIILDRFLPSYLPNNLKIQNFENMQNQPGDVIILNKCNINDNHMMYGSWDTEHDGQTFLSF